MNVIWKIDDPQEELDQVANYSDVRIFKSALYYIDTPQEDLIGIAQNWAVPDQSRSSNF